MSLFIVKMSNSYTCLGDNGAAVKGWAFKCDDVKVFSGFQFFMNLNIWRLLPPFTFTLEVHLVTCIHELMHSLSYWSTFAVIIFKDPTPDTHTHTFVSKCIFPSVDALWSR